MGKVNNSLFFFFPYNNLRQVRDEYLRLSRVINSLISGFENYEVRRGVRNLFLMSIPDKILLFTVISVASTLILYSVGGR